MDNFTRLMLKKTKPSLVKQAMWFIIFLSVIFTVPFLTMAVYEFMTPFMLPRVVDEGWITGRIDYWHAFCLNFFGGGALFWSRK